MAIEDASYDARNARFLSLPEALAGAAAGRLRWDFRGATSGARATRTSLTAMPSRNSVRSHDETGPTHVAFLRAINVGGHVVKMDRLRALFEALGHSRVETFIASGNVAFAVGAKAAGAAAALETEVERHLHASLGWEVATFLRTPAELRAVAARRPFGEPPADGTKTSEYVAFLKTAPPIDARARVLAYRSDVDDFAFDGRELHWRVQGSALDSKLTGGKLEKLLGGPVTVRNVTTVRKIAASGER